MGNEVLTEMNNQQSLSDDELEKVSGGFIVSDRNGTYNVNPDYIISEINKGNLELIKNMIIGYMFTNWVTKEQVYEIIKQEFSLAGKQIPASLKAFLEF